MGTPGAMGTTAPRITTASAGNVETVVLASCAWNTLSSLGSDEAGRLSWSDGPSASWAK